MHYYCITFDIHFSLCKVNLFQCTGRHLRLIDMCGLFMSKIIIFEKFSGCGLYSGALNSPEITVHLHLHYITLHHITFTFTFTFTYSLQCMKCPVLLFLRFLLQCMKCPVLLFLRFLFFFYFFLFFLPTSALNSARTA